MKYKKYLASGLVFSVLLNSLNTLSFAFNPVIPSNSDVISYSDDITEIDKPYEMISAGETLAKRISSTSQIIGDKIYIIGGTNSGSLEIYDIETKTSYYGKSMTMRRDSMTTVVVDGKIYCIGGDDGYISSKVEVYDPVTDSWETKTSMPTKRKDLTSAVVDGKIYCIGGYNGSYLNTVEVYDPVTDSWETKASMPTARNGLGSVVFNNEIYCIGGFNIQSQKYQLECLEVYNPLNDTWSTRGGESWDDYYVSFGECMFYQLIDNKIYAVDVKKDSSSWEDTAMYVYNIEKDSWSREIRCGYLKYFGYKSTSVCYKNDIYIIGGSYNPNSIVYIKTKAKIPTVLNYAESFAEGDGSKNNPYQISTASELSRLAHLVNDERISTNNMYFELINDIDLNTYDTDNSLSNGNWTPIGVRAINYSSDRDECYYEYSFRGVFDGNGHTIANLKNKSSNSDWHIGLFGFIEKAEIVNLNITNIQISSIQQDLPNYTVGGLAGYADIGCKIKNVHTSGVLEGGYVIGGLVGLMMDYLPNYVDDCTTNVNILASNSSYSMGGLIGEGENLIINNCHSFGTIDYIGNPLEEFSYLDIGGLIGNVCIYDCSDYGDFTFEIQNSTSNTKINLDEVYINKSDIGGFIGQYYGDSDEQPSIRNCFSYSEIEIGSSSESTNIGGFIGLLSSYTNVENSFSTGFIKGDNIKEVGGFIGMSKSYYKDDIFTIKNCYSLVDIEGATKVGGVIGNLKNNFANIKNYYYAGKVTKAEGEESTDSIFYTIIATLGDINIDLNNTDVFSRIYYDKNNININIEDINIPIGLTTEQMQGKEPLNNMNFDFTNLWKLNKEYYPTFEQINTAPEIIVNQDVKDNTITINQYDKFNLLDYVTTKDFEGDEVIVTIKEIIDTTKYGVFPITVVATDDKGLSSELTLNLKINPLMIKVNEAPVIIAEDIILTIGDEFDASKLYLAVDKENGIIMDKVKIIENTVNMNKAGVYKVTYEVTDKDGAKATKTITVTVKEKVVSNNNQSNSTTTDDKKDTTTEKPQTSDIGFIGLSGILMSTVGLYSINRKKNK